MNTLNDSYKQKGRRLQLVHVLEHKKITDKSVLNAISTVPRHLFMSRDFEDKAYEDIALPIEEGQTISQPFTVAFQTQSLKIKPGDKVLEIGTGSGYQAAILAEMGAEVFSIERIEKLHLKSKRILGELYKTVRLFLQDGTLGLPEHAPFDKIIVTAAAPKLQEVLLAQLKPGGLAIIPVGDLKNQKMVLAQKSLDGTISQKEMGDFRFVPLIGREGWKE